MPKVRPKEKIAKLEQVSRFDKRILFEFFGHKENDTVIPAVIVSNVYNITEI